MNVRDAKAGEVDQLAQIWFDGWQDAHAQILPAELRRLRTLESFRERLDGGLQNVRVAEVSGSPAGFYMVKGDELDQLYVSASARGTGVAVALMSDAEARFREAGVKTAWLACAIGNERATRFYEKCGWTRVGTMTHHAETSEGPYSLEVWRYERSLSRADNA